MGVELVEGRDLICSGGTVRMRDTRGERRVDVIYRRVDDEFLDPVQFRHDSVLGCPGLLTAARAGNVTIANAVGNGVADDKLIYTYLPDLVRYYLGEEPVLPNVADLAPRGAERARGSARPAAELVVKPVDGAGGKGLVIGPQASARSSTALAKRLRAEPARLDRPARCSAVDGSYPAGDGLAPRHVDLRPFAVNDGHDVWVLPGGLTRVALVEGSLVVNSSQGGGSKDTWVLAGERSRWATPRPSSPAAGSRSHRCPRRTSRATCRCNPQQQQQQQQMSATVHVEPHSRVAVLDRPVRRTCGGHQPDA